tara:strand:- start:1520 stop:1915 length:396 start_codon:yes stop_codon:yes gene_type:complete
MLDKDKILSILEAFASSERMSSFFIDNATSDFLFVRPSGNPIDAKGFEEMWSSGDLVLESAEITKVHRFDFLCEDAAMCVFTLGSKFTYKGKPNNDLPTVTSIFKRIDGIWKIAWMQRSSGQSDMSLWKNV